MCAIAFNGGIFALGGKHHYSSGAYWYRSIGEFAALSSITDEYIHFGSDEINPSGNLSRSYTDMSWDAPGFTVNIGRTYNSKDTRKNAMFGSGWTFGFQGFVDTSGNDVVIRLPNGGAQTFRVESNGTYTAKDSRSTLVKNANNTYTLTTKDRYTYGFNTTGHLTSMADRNGNTLNAATKLRSLMR